MDEIIIASRNKGKIKEFKKIFDKVGIHVKSLDDLENKIPEIEETGRTFHENAQIKAETVAKLINKPVMADDSGLEVVALDNRPGVYSARYAGEPTNDVKNYEKILQELKKIDNINSRTAQFVTVLALARPGEETIFFEGFCKGRIALEAKGIHGFGYDPIFIPQGYDETMAELTAEEKNKISHRNDALQKLFKWLRKE